MNYDDEDYVRLYTRDTITWKMLGWQGRTVLLHMLKGKFDRAGVFVTGRHELSRAVTAATDLPIEIVEPGLERLLEEGVWIAGDGCLVWPTYVEAQTAVRSDKARKREERARRAALAAAKEQESRTKVPRDSESRNVTGGHNESHAVTNCHPSLAEPSREIPPTPQERDRPRPPDPFGDHHAGKRPQQRPDVRELFELFCETFGYTGRRIDAANSLVDAEILAEAIDAYGLDDCRLVCSLSKFDKMVTGEQDEQRRKHDSIRYIFGNADTFARILRSAKQGHQDVRRGNVAEEIAAAKAMGDRE